MSSGYDSHGVLGVIILSQRPKGAKQEKIRMHNRACEFIEGKT